MSRWYKLQRDAAGELIVTFHHHPEKRWFPRTPCPGDRIMDHASARRIWQRAAKLAARSHQHQLRKDGTTPYLCHPVRVALTVQQQFGESDPIILAAALLHDVIEDTTCDFDDIQAACGEEVAVLVAALSKDKRIREDRREIVYAQQIAAADWRARLIKLADVYDNLCNAAESDCGVNVWDQAEEAIAASRDQPAVSSPPAR